jgi:hypothetical protein
VSGDWPGFGVRAPVHEAVVEERRLLPVRERAAPVGYRGKAVPHVGGRVPGSRRRVDRTALAAGVEESSPPGIVLT